MSIPSEKVGSSGEYYEGGRVFKLISIIEQ